MLKLVQAPSIRNLSCTILPGKQTHAGPIPKLHNPAFLYWRDTWSEFFRRAGSPPDALKVDSFLRADYIIVLHDGPTIAGMLLSTIFHTEALSTYEHPQIAPYPPAVLERLRNFRSGRCLSGEYLSVHPEYRKSELGISLAEIMVGLLQRIFLSCEAEMLLASTVRAAHVAEIARDYGYEEVGSYLKLGVDCVMMCNTAEGVVEHPRAEVREAIQRFWAFRHDYSHLSGVAPAIAKAA